MDSASQIGRLPNRSAMKRREFIVSSVAGSVGAGLAHNPLTAILIRRHAADAVCRRARF